MSFMLGIERFLNDLAKHVARTIRRFATFILLVFFAGTVFGLFASQVAPRLGLPADWLIAAPLILAVFAYYVTEVAFLIFILLLIGFLIILL